jgi:NADPH-dependent 2,4-dienoyl-CoA reductase/sulfur reductase-like enzyme
MVKSIAAAAVAVHRCVATPRARELRTGNADFLTGLTVGSADVAGRPQAYRPGSRYTDIHRKEVAAMIQPADTSIPQQELRGFKVLVAGAGVAGLEAASALHELAGARVDVTVLSPRSEFVYRPDAVKEPFVSGYGHRYPLTALARRPERG